MRVYSARSGRLGRGMLSGDGGRSAGHAGRAQEARGEISPFGPTWPRELANCPTRTGVHMVVLCVEEDRVEVDLRSTSLHRLCERGGTGWVSGGRFDLNQHRAVCREGTFATHRGGDAVAAPLDDPAMPGCARQGNLSFS